MKAFTIVILLISFGCLSAIIIKDEEHQNKDKGESDKQISNSGITSVKDSESGKKGEEVTENKKQVYSEEMGNKGKQSHSADHHKEGHHSSYGNHNEKQKHNVKRKKSKQTKGFHDKYHLDEEKSGHYHWSGADSKGSFFHYKKKKKAGEEGNKNDDSKKGNNVEIRQDRSYPGMRYVEVKWHNR